MDDEEKQSVSLVSPKKIETVQDLIAFLEDECYLHSPIRVQVGDMHRMTDHILVVHHEGVDEGYRIVGAYDG